MPDVSKLLLMRANASVHTCTLGQPEFNMKTSENLNSELRLPHRLFFCIRTGSACDKSQSGTLQEAEEIKVLAQ